MIEALANACAVHLASPHPFEPLMPSDARMEPLLSKAGDLARAATAPAGKRVPPEFRTLLRSMNAYDTNRIEGQHTRPHEVEMALAQDFSSNKALAARQRLAVAHIDAEAGLEQRYPGEGGARALYSLAGARLGCGRGPDGQPRCAA